MASQHIVSHVTGVVTNFGLSVGKGELKSALSLLIVPIFFLGGSVLSGYLVDLRLHMNKRPKYYLTFGFIFFLLLLVYILGVSGFFGPFGKDTGDWREFLLLSLLCLICGIQNGTITIVSKSVIRTTHLTGLTTDLGLGIVRFFNRDLLKGVVKNEGRANFIRLGIICSFALGALIGGLSFQAWSYQAFLLPTGISGGLFLMMFYFQFLVPSKQSD